MLAYFDRLESHNIPQLQDEVVNLKSYLKTLPKNQIDAIMETKDKIQEKKKQIKTHQKEKQAYFLDNSKYIFDYFESKKQISSGEPPQNVNVLNSFFKVKSTNPERQDVAKYIQAKKLYQDYWYNVNNEFTNIQDYFVECDRCEVCLKGEMVPQEDEGIMICNNLQCGRFITHIVDSNKPNNKEPPTNTRRGH
jgi:hypothetical protein